METLILSKQDVSKLLNMKGAITSVEQAYIKFSSNKVIHPPTVSIDDTEHNVELDSRIFKRAKIYFDSKAQCIERGDTRDPYVSYLKPFINS